MKKFFAVLGWVALTACAVFLLSVLGERDALRRDFRREQKKYEALKALRQEERQQWELDWQGIRQDNAALTMENQALAAALNDARQPQIQQEETPDPAQQQEPDRHAHPEKRLPVWKAEPDAPEIVIK